MPKPAPFKIKNGAAAPSAGTSEVAHATRSRRADGVVELQGAKVFTRMFRQNALDADLKLNEMPFAATEA